MTISIAFSGIKILDFLLVNDTNAWARVMMHEFYNQENMDILLVGASHLYYGINAEVVTEETGKDVFAASTSGQKPDASLALIKEAYELYGIEEAYLEISETIAENYGEIKDRTDLTSTYLVLDYMQPSLNRLDLMLNSSSMEYYINAIVPSKRYTDEILNYRRTAGIVLKKFSASYRNYGTEYINNEKRYYTSKSHVAWLQGIAEDSYYYANEELRNMGRISDDWKACIEETIDYCSEHNIKLTFIDMPISHYLLSMYENYDEYISFIREFIQDKDVNYVEFNLIGSDYVPYSSENFRDMDHLNESGSKFWTKILVDYMSGELPDEVFSKSIDEVLEKDGPSYYGISYEDGEKNRHLNIITNSPGYFEYQVKLINEDGSEVMIQEWSTSLEMDVSLDLLHNSNTETENGQKLSISYRIVKDTSSEKTVTVTMK